MEALVRSLPRLIRSISEPTLHRNYLQADEYDYLYTCQSPKTPVNTLNSQFGGAFPFFSSTMNHNY